MVTHGNILHKLFQSKLLFPWEIIRQNKMSTFCLPPKTQTCTRKAHNTAIGTPFAITVDHQTLEDNTVTIRERDTMEQIRVSADGVSDIIRGLLSGKIQFEAAGTLV